MLTSPSQIRQDLGQIMKFTKRISSRIKDVWYAFDSKKKPGEARDSKSIHNSTVDKLVSFEKMVLFSILLILFTPLAIAGAIDRVLSFLGVDPSPIKAKINDQGIEQAPFNNSPLTFGYICYPLYSAFDLFRETFEFLKLDTACKFIFTLVNTTIASAVSLVVMAVAISVVVIFTAFESMFNLLCCRETADINKDSTTPRVQNPEHIYYHHLKSSNQEWLQARELQKKQKSEKENLTDTQIEELEVKECDGTRLYPRA